MSSAVSSLCNCKANTVLEARFTSIERSVSSMNNKVDNLMNLVKTSVTKQTAQIDQNKKNKTHMVNDILPRGTKSNPIAIE